MDFVSNQPLLQLRTRRRAFEAWSILVPIVFQETFIEDDRYWHAWTEQASISLTSIVMTERRRAVAAEALIGALSPIIEGPLIDDLPPGLIGCAAIGPSPQPARAATGLSGLLAVDGRLLLTTITSDDVSWLRETWLSIQAHPAQLPAGIKPARPTKGKGEKRRRRAA